MDILWQIVNTIEIQKRERGSESLYKKTNVRRSEDLCVKWKIKQYR